MEAVFVLDGRGGQIVGVEVVERHDIDCVERAPAEIAGRIHPAEQRLHENKCSRGALWPGAIQVYSDRRFGSESSAKSGSFRTTCQIRIFVQIEQLHFAVPWLRSKAAVKRTEPQ